MEEQKKFPEQDAPYKNTDRAYVQVKKDGSPLVPDEQAPDEEREQDRTASPKPEGESGGR